MTAANRVPAELIHSSILNGQKALIVGIANDRSIAWGCAQAMHRAGAEIAMTYLNERARPFVEPPGQSVLTALGMTIQRHEQTFGSIELDIRRRAQPGQGGITPLPK